MSQRPLEELTFREKIRDCAHRTRELIEHIDQNLVRHLHAAHKKMRPQHAGQEEEITDVSVRTLVAAALDSQRYADQIEDQIEAYGKSIDDELAKILKRPTA